MAEDNGAAESAAVAVLSENSNTCDEKLTFLELISEEVTTLTNRTFGALGFADFDALEMRKRIMAKLNCKKIFLCIIIGLTRGNNVPRILSTMKSREWKNEFESAVRTLDIKPKVSDRRSVITLSRMITCFPVLATKIMAEDEDIPNPVPYSYLQVIHSEYPKCARHECCASLLVDKMGENSILMALDVILIPYLMKSEIIYSKERSWRQKSKTERAKFSARNLQKSYKSNVLQADAREHECIGLGIVTASGELSATWVSVAEKARVWLRDNYGFCNFDGFLG